MLMRILFLSCATSRLDREDDARLRDHLRERAQRRDATHEVDESQNGRRTPFTVDHLEAVEASQPSLSQKPPQLKESKPMHRGVCCVVSQIWARGHGKPLVVALQRSGIPAVQW